MLGNPGGVTLSSRAMPPTLFLRDDDAGALNDALCGFHDVFAARGLPVSYQVIPAQLTDECASWLRDIKRKAPDLIEIGQHGHTHEMMVAGRLEYFEFGPERSLDEQRAVIKQGRAIMQDKLGDAADPRLFTPPRHRFNRDTLVALGEAGFSVISASSYPKPLHQMAYRAGRLLGLTNIGRGGVSHHGGIRPEAPLFELSISVAVDDGAPRERDVEDVMRAIANAAKITPYVGLMFHHNAWGSQTGMAFLGSLADRLAAMTEARFATLGQIADEQRSA